MEAEERGLEAEDTCTSDKVEEDGAINVRQEFDQEENVIKHQGELQLTSDKAHDDDVDLKKTNKTVDVYLGEKDPETVDDIATSTSSAEGVALSKENSDQACSDTLKIDDKSDDSQANDESEIEGENIAVQSVEAALDEAAPSEAAPIETTGSVGETTLQETPKFEVSADQGIVLGTAISIEDDLQFVSENAEIGSKSLMTTHSEKNQSPENDNNVENKPETGAEEAHETDNASMINDEELKRGVEQEDDEEEEAEKNRQESQSFSPTMSAKGARQAAIEAKKAVLDATRLACPVCGERGKLCCSACFGAYYCCSEHVKADWNTHKAACKKVKKLKQKKPEAKKCFGEVSSDCPDDMNDLTPVVRKGSRISLHYKAMHMNRRVFDSTAEEYGGVPVVTTAGVGLLLPALDRAVIGMRAGQTSLFAIISEGAFGAVSQAWSKSAPLPVDAPFLVSISVEKVFS